MTRTLVRLRFSKQGNLRLLGHRDLMRCVERVFRRAGLPLRFSAGFHPKPRMSFPSALALGIEGLDEVLEVELTAPVEAAELMQRLTVQSPPGLNFHKAELLPAGSPRARLRSTSYEVLLPPQYASGLQSRVEHLLATAHCPVQRPGRRYALDLRAQVLELACAGDKLRMRLRATDRGGVSPRDVLTALGLEGVEAEGARLCRIAVEVEP